MNKTTDKDFYCKVINESLFPFWDKAVDRKNGGVFTCFDNTGAQLLSKDKYTWSQGRFLWIWSRFIENIQKGNISEPGAGALKRLEEDAHKTASFLLKNCFLDSGHVIFLLSETGEPKTINDGAPLDASIYADFFVCLGLSEYARVYRNESIAVRALELYRNINGRLNRGAFHTEPYPIPSGCEMLGIPMFAMYTGSELSQALFALGKPETDEIVSMSEKYSSALENDFFIRPHNIEVKCPASMNDTLHARHFTPGHILECLWFYIHFKEFLQKLKHSAALVHLPDFLSLSDEIGRYALDRAWDTEKGGIFRYIDREGGKPKGRLLNDRYENLVTKTWDTKLWWVHSESLYFCALMARRLETENVEAAFYWQGMYKKIFDYTFSVFPNPNSSIGEWIQIRRRDGSPMNEVVALPVKDPYHIFRNILLLIEL